MKVILNLATAGLTVVAELFALGTWGNRAVDVLVPLLMVGRVLECVKDVLTFVTTGDVVMFKGFSSPEKVLHIAAYPPGAGSVLTSLLLLQQSASERVCLCARKQLTVVTELFNEHVGVV